MLLKFTGAYKSLTDFSSESLNHLVVITGKNGSGKSQLLEIIQKDSSVSNAKKSLIFSEPILKVKTLQLTIPDKGLASYDYWNSSFSLLKNKWITDVKIPHKKIIDVLINKNIKVKTAIDTSFEFLLNSEITGWTDEECLNILKDGTYPIFRHSELDVKAAIKIIKEYFIENFNLISQATYISIKKNKSALEIVESDFANSSDINIIPIIETFDLDIFNLFYDYAVKRKNNTQQFIDKSIYSAINESTSPKDFESIYVSPWDEFNTILLRENLDYYFKGISDKDFSFGSDIKITLIKKSSNVEIDLTDLSSGEKIIFGLMALSFKLRYIDENNGYTQLILLDEPDTHLHPEYIKRLLDIIINTIVKKYQIRVFLTTHSPTTVALSPEDSLYQLNNEPSTTLVKISKDNALKQLTDYIPALSIDYKNHKQVIVESPTDVFYYQTLYNQLNTDLKEDIKLYFISNSYGKGNCTQVIEMVKAFNKSGNEKVFGIIDYDLINKIDSKSNIFVHGYKERYSLETYVYDPIYILCLFLEIKAYNSLHELGFNETFNPYNIGQESSEKLQQMSNWLFDKIYNRFPGYRKQDDLRRLVNFHNGKAYEVPIWYLDHNGHTLEKDIIKQTFEPLKASKFTNEGELQKALTVTAARCYPFVSTDTIKVIKDILN